MLRFVFSLVVVWVWSWTPALAQQDEEEIVWVQIAARPSLAGALEQAEEFASRLEDVAGFAIAGGWYAVALGPYRAEDAEQVLRVLRQDRLIPRDSYVAPSQNYGTQFFPSGQDILRREAAALPEEPEEPADAPEPVTEVRPEPAAQPAQEAAPEPLPLPAPEPTRLAALEDAARVEVISDREARQTEAALSAAEKRGLQEALQWAGFYNSTIDGAFGRGTRRAMAEWQRFNNLTETGVLSPAQQALLLGQYNEILDGLGLALYRDEEAGLAIQLPLDIVRFDRYEPPFVHFTPLSPTDAQVLLISQPGNRDTLRSLYEVMQTLEIVPLEGPRALSGDGFSLIGRSDRVVSETQVTLEDGALKGFTLVWPAGDETRRARLVSEMRRSLARLDGVLDPATGAGAAQQIDFVSGLAVRKPRLARSGFFVTETGTVVTTVEAVQGCARILIDDQHEARLSVIDHDRGLAVLVPEVRLAPPGIAEFSAVPPRLQSDVAVAGYSYEGLLGAPTMTFGTLADLRGLRGEQDLKRLQLASLPGDAGGPVFDGNGHVVGMLLPRSETNRQLPEDVSFALSGTAITQAAAAAGIAVQPANGAEALAPEDITTRGLGMTTLVSCWD